MYRYDDYDRALVIERVAQYRDQLQRNLAHPALADLRAICETLLPEPTPDIITRIGAQCGKHPHR